MFLDDFFEKKCINENMCMDERTGRVVIYRNPSMYLASINAYNEGKKCFYGSLSHGKFIAEEPKYEYRLKRPLNEKEYAYLEKKFK